VYTEGGGSYTHSAVSYTWAYLYASSGKIGIVFECGYSQFFNLGLTACGVGLEDFDPIKNAPVDNSGMQNTVNGFGGIW
jgi:hypothetical protein